MDRKTKIYRSLHQVCADIPIEKCSNNIAKRAEHDIARQICSAVNDGREYVVKVDRLDNFDRTKSRDQAEIDELERLRQQCTSSDKPVHLLILTAYITLKE
jgi:hypothetical protein